MPFPQNEANAMDVVIQFAVHKLGFQLNDIVVYAWSIGGFTGKRLVTHSVRLPPSAALTGLLALCLYYLYYFCRSCWVH